jgi:ADP-ribose pyrophosphatase YjhB (NUDIX family)
VSPTIRFVALGAVHRGEELLVQEDEEPGEGTYYRLLGGGVEFGEHSREAVVREFAEELGVTLRDPTHVGTFERVFTYDDERGHEVWRVYDGDIAEEWPYERDVIRFHEPETGEDHLARWVSREALRAEGTTFYAPAVLDALDGAGTREG